MKALVGIKRVVDYAVKVRVKADNSGVELNNVKMSMNPFCEIAMEEAVRLKEKNLVKEVIVLTIGNKQAAETLRSALALGADKGIHILTEQRIDQDLQPLAVAKIFKHFVQRDNYDLVLLGKQAIDDDYNQTAQMLAGLLGWPQATFLSKLELGADKSVKATREVDGGLQTLSMKLPAVFSCDLRLNEPRFVKIQEIMKAKKKPLEEIKIETLGIDVAPRIKVQKVETPAARAGGVKVESVDQLIEKLRNEAKVI